MPILAKGKTIKGHIWTYVRNDRPFAGRAPPAALYYASRDRRHEHPTRHLHGFNGILQADAYSGYNELYDPSRTRGPITAALCWAHARRQFFELADIAANARRGKKAAAISPIALEAVKRIDSLFDIERGINGQSAAQRLRMRKELSAPLVAALEAWLAAEAALHVCDEFSIKPTTTKDGAFCAPAAVMWGNGRSAKALYRGACAWLPHISREAKRRIGTKIVRVRR